MKKTKLILIMLLLILCGCNAKAPQSNHTSPQNKSGAVWISFYEVKEILTSEKGVDAELDEIINNLSVAKITDVYVHTRSHCDAIYPSKIFPKTKEAEVVDFDFLELMVEKFHRADIKIHAWINPYRVAISEDASLLNVESPVAKWLNDTNNENDKNVSYFKGIYLNPAEVEVQKLVIDGVKEIVENYNVDGIHFDDYFYPTTEPEFDKASYDEYCKNTENPLQLSDWRRCNVNALISGCYNAIKKIDAKCEFSISPAASIENNFNTLYADAKYWVENGTVDAIIPQLYFGFEYPDISFRFNNLLDDWQELANKNPKVKLIIGLGIYKANTEATADKPEWNKNRDIIAKQVKICLENNYVDGYAFYSYSSLFSTSEPFISHRENILKIINSSLTEV